MAKPLTRGQKAAETRKRNAAEREVPPIPRTKKETIVITAEQFMAGIKRLTDGFDSLARLEELMRTQQRDDSRAYNPDAGAYPDTAGGNYNACSGAFPLPRISEVPKKPSSDTAPVSVLIDDVHSRSSALRSRLESLRDSLVHGIHPDSPERGNSVAMAGTPSQGPSKDALNYSFGNLAASEALVEEIERYLLNR